MAQDTSTIGSVGHLVGAAFETTGHYLQSALLDTFSLGFGAKFGVLIFVASAIAAFLTVIIFGGYRLWGWFIFGPTIFFSLVAIRTPSSGANWSFGSREYSFAPVQEATNGIKTENPVVPQFTIDNPASVSFFFALWNKVTSLITRTLTFLVDSFSKNSDLTFISKGERYLQLFHPKVSDPSLKFFINMTAVNKCGDYFIRMKEYYTPGVGTVRRQDLEQTMKLEGAAPKLSSDDYQSLFQWMADLHITSDVMADIGQKTTLSCDDLWKIGIVAFQRHSALYIDQIADANRPPELSKADVIKDIEKKFNQYITYPPNASATLNGDQQLLTVINEVAARMFVNELATIRPSLIQAEYGAPTAGILGDLERGPGETSSMLRQIMTTDSWEEKGDYLMATLSLPYIQGFVLYFLAMSFPFFCLSVLIPGRFHGILLWMGLWLWAKLWDFGFAVVMLLDRILYTLLPHGMPISDDVVKDPARTLKALLEVDPSYSVYTYYHILATALAAVPIVTGFIVKKAGGDLMDIVSQSLTTFSGRIGYSLASHARSAASQENFEQYVRNTDHALQRAIGGMSSDPKIRAAMDEKSTMIAATKYWGMAGLTVPQAYTSAGAARADGVLSALVNLQGQQAVYNADTSAINRSIDARSQLNYYNSHSNSELMYAPGQVIGMVQAYNSFPGMEGVGGGMVNFSIDEKVNQLKAIDPGLPSIILGKKVLDVSNGTIPASADDYGGEKERSFGEAYKARVEAEQAAYTERTKERRW